MNGVMGPLINGLINGYLGLFHPELNGEFANLLITGDFAAHFVGNFSGFSGPDTGGRTPTLDGWLPTTACCKRGDSSKFRGWCWMMLS